MTARTLDEVRKEVSDILQTALQRTAPQSRLTFYAIAVEMALCGIAVEHSDHEAARVAYRFADGFAMGAAHDGR